ncbi:MULTISPECIES: hypothetical protein, partial [Pseudomonas]|uniref:hypothetical protein n=1 Tax=Pseudomonas TaxID=286 RepID=UPI001BEB901F
KPAPTEKQFAATYETALSFTTGHIQKVATALAHGKKRFSRRRKDNDLLQIEKVLLLTWIIAKSVTVRRSANGRTCKGARQASTLRAPRLRCAAFTLFA